MNDCFVTFNNWIILIRSVNDSFWVFDIWLGVVNNWSLANFHGDTMRCHILRLLIFLIFLLWRFHYFVRPWLVMA